MFYSSKSSILKLSHQCQKHFNKPATPIVWFEKSGILFSSLPTNHLQSTAWFSRAWWNTKPCFEATFITWLRLIGTSMNTLRVLSRDQTSDSPKKSLNIDEEITLCNNEDFTRIILGWTLPQLVSSHQRIHLFQRLSISNFNLALRIENFYQLKKLNENEVEPWMK